MTETITLVAFYRREEQVYTVFRCVFNGGVDAHYILCRGMTKDGPYLPEKRWDNLYDAVVWLRKNNYFEIGA